MLTSAQRGLIDNTAPFEGMHLFVHQKRGCLAAVWDFAVQGGAVGSLSLLDDLGNPAILPDKAIICQVYIDIITAMTSTGGTGTIALTANSSGDLLAAVDADTLPLSASHPQAGVPVGTAATMVKLTAARTIVMEIATNALLTGKIRVFIDFVLSA